MTEEHNTGAMELAGRLEGLIDAIRTDLPYNEIKLIEGLTDEAAALLRTQAEENERLRDALRSAESWLDRWAKHVGSCPQGRRCTCGLTAIHYEVLLALHGPKHPPSGDDPPPLEAGRKTGGEV